MICLIFLVLGVFRLTYYILFSVHSRFGVTVKHAKVFDLTLSQYIITDSTLARNLIASRLQTLQVCRTSANVRTKFALSKSQRRKPKFNRNTQNSILVQGNVFKSFCLIIINKAQGKIPNSNMFYIIGYVFNLRYAYKLFKSYRAQQTCEAVA